ncbi:MAG: glutamate 5-kinase [Peptococcaceae bacterium]|nr:glutamate 5-kinase [Peptococcaceae bacterium]MBR2627540.1 glutamate 5-kinase [Peptococcaceae bacterium]
MGRETYQALVANAQKIVVKVGTSTLTHKNGKLNLEQIEKLVRQLSDLRNQGKDVVLVSSGAIGAGMGKLNLEERPKTIPEKQAVAAVGQGILLHIYEKIFSEYGQATAQLLLTKADLEHRQRFLNGRNTLLTLLRLGVIPIVNENDTVAFEEIKFGDNDTLAALVGTLIDADLVILLTDIDGFYDGDPRKNKQAKRISVVEVIDEQIESLAGSVGSKFGSGGMATKITAASIAVNAGIPLMIAHGAEEHIIRRLTNGEDAGTLFLPIEIKPHLRKKWIAFGSHVDGRVVVDDGAREALIHKGKSLLPSGIVAVEGSFSAGDVVGIIDANGKEFARGITNYGTQELNRIKGQKSKDICPILGYKDFDEVIHRDNLSLIL